jgi:hypothetical protein
MFFPSSLKNHIMQYAPYNREKKNRWVEWLPGLSDADPNFSANSYTSNNQDAYWILLPWPTLTLSFIPPAPFLYAKNTTVHEAFHSPVPKDWLTTH